MGPPENTLLTGTLIVTLLNIGLLTFLLTWGVLSIHSRQNKFDHLPHTAVLQQKTLWVRTGVVAIFVSLIIIFGLWVTIRNGNARYPDSVGKGGIPAEMPYKTITQLKAKIEDTLYDPEQTLNNQTRSTLISLDAALTDYQNQYTATTYNNWDSVQNLLVYMEETEEKIPELSQQIPKYNHAKERLIKYVDENEPYIAPTDAMRPLWLNKIVWLERPFWNYLLIWGLVGMVCFLGIFAGYSMAHGTVHAQHSPAATAAHKQNLKTAVLKQLSDRYPYAFHIHQNDARPANKGYFFIIHCFNHPIPENDSSQALPIKCLIFNVDPNGQIENPICEATYIRDNTGTQQEISATAHTNLIKYTSNTFNHDEIQDLGSSLQLEIDTTNNPSRQQMATLIIDQLLGQGHICEIFDHLKEIRPKDNWFKT